jgi:hypothetical protein
MRTVLRLPIGSFRPGWSRSPAAAVALVARIALLVFAFHLSGGAHLLADVLLDDDMTCVDELARHAHHGSTAPLCPAAQGLGHGHGFVPPATADVLLAPPVCVDVQRPRRTDGAPPFVLPRTIDRPPRA